MLVDMAIELIIIIYYDLTSDILQDYIHTGSEHNNINIAS